MMDRNSFNNLPPPPKPGPIQKPSQGPISETKFKIDKTRNIPYLPDIKDKTKINVRYPLIAPYAYAHIFWDHKNNELVYIVEEPPLNEEESYILESIEKGIEELINISFINVKKTEVIISYLEENIRVLLAELGIKVTQQTFLKLMYYVYRDFVGLNEIEPLLNDYLIEDIECNGINTPIYLVHRKYRNIKTNIVYRNVNKLTSFVEKLAQKCGKYISYASPLLDGRLPDKSRVNATFTEDISTRGPTFTIRKFTSEPFSPVRLMQLRTLSPEMLAYLWLLVEHEANFIIIGGTGSGKSSLLNSLAFFIPPQARIVSIEDSVTGDAEIIMKRGDKIETTQIAKITEKIIRNPKEKQSIEILTLDKNYKIKFIKPSKWIKHKVNKDIYKIVTATGREVKVTKDHSLFALGEFGLKEIKPADLRINKSFISVPRKIPFECKKIKEINIYDHLKYFKTDFLYGKPIEKIFASYTDYKKLGISKNKYYWWKKRNMIKIDHLLKLKWKFSYKDLKNIKIRSKLKNGIPIIFPISNTFLEFLGLWIGDGSYDNFNANRVILSNSDKECINIVKKLAKELRLNTSIMNDNISYTINSTIFYKFMKYVLKFDGTASSKRIPSLIHNLSNNQVKKFLKGYFSADGSPSSDYEITCSSQSYKLLEDIQTLFLRLGIISRIKHSERLDKCRELTISSLENKIKFKENISFLQKRKIKKLDLICSKNVPHHTFSDIIPLNIGWLKEVDKYRKLSCPYSQGGQNIGRNYLQEIYPTNSNNIMQENPMGSPWFNKGLETENTYINQLGPREKINFLRKMSQSDIFWDKVKKVEKLKRRARYVYDISVPKTEKFICSNVILHNTHELNLIHENWLPSVSREPTGVGAEGKLGEISLYTLLRESFRQRPDYVIVGEIRGKEAYVLFQGAASGHATACTMHAEDVETMVKRLETPPINLSPSLVEIIDVVCVMAQTKVAGVEVRRVKNIVEVINVGERGTIKTNTPFIWDPRSDTFYFKTESAIFHKLAKNLGLSLAELQKEFRNRSKLLMALYKNRISDYKKVQEIINAYYKKPQDVLRRFNI